MFLQPFDQQDFQAFNGVVGANPLINYNHTIVLDGVVYENTTTIVDDNGLEFYVFDQHLTTVAAWHWHTDYHTAKFTASNGLNWLALTTDGLQAFGFVVLA